MSATAPRYQAGFGRASITAYPPALAMFGWGHPGNRPMRVAAPLYARALALETAAPGQRVVYVCCDLGMISEELRRSVCDGLATDGIALDDASLMLTATHTHSGPSGLSDYLFYATAGPGFVPALCAAIAKGIVDAIRAAVDALTPARLTFNEGVIPLTDPIAFNRSFEAYNRNRDVTPVTYERRDEAVDRTMAVIRVDDDAGAELGMLTWFGLHGTCIHRDNTAIHPDHKGEAATRVEAYARARGIAEYVAIFAQTAPGDVTPNHRWCSKRELLVGWHDDDFESAAFVGEVQARHAIAIAERAPCEGSVLDGRLDAAMAYVDMFDAPVDRAFAAGRSGLRTSPGVLGWPFLGGTTEGQGPLGAIAGALPMLSNLKLQGLAAAGRGDEPVDAKVPFWELGKGREGRVFGVFRATGVAAGLVPESHARYFAKAVREPATADAPWVPRVVPLQVFRIGGVAIAALPVEPTVTSGRRIARVLGDALGGEAERVVVNGYANAYAGYLATPEEYVAQRYEGASTLYGPWSLPALSTAIHRLGVALREGRALETLPRPSRPVPARVPLTSTRVVGVPSIENSPPPAGTPAERLQWFFEALARTRESCLDQLPSVFTEDVIFRDPFRHTTGIEPFRVLFERMFRRYPEVGFSDFHATGDTERFTLTYAMHLRMVIGPSFVTPMASLARVCDGRVCELVDYYDFPTGLVSPSGVVRDLYKQVVRTLFL